MTSYTQLRRDSRKEFRSLKNRLHSIILDNAFLENEVIPFFEQFPVIPNERCGLWYCKPLSYSTTSYFKSTDGHMNQWDFSLRRLNLHLLPLLSTNQGIIIVDSTRRGKKIPDALSKTVPIWCAVLNQILHEDSPLEECLFVPPGTVSTIEYEIIKQKLPGLLQKVQDLGIISKEMLKSFFGEKFLRPIWVYPGCSILSSSYDPFTGKDLQVTWNTESDIIPLILTTVSYQVQDGVDVREDFTYVQGAADDHELWSNGLTPEIFWENIDVFQDAMKTNEELIETSSRILEAKSLANRSQTGAIFDQIDKITNAITMGQIKDNLRLNKDMIESLKNEYSSVYILSNNIDFLAEDKINLIHHYRLQSNSKKSSRELRAFLPEICASISCLLKDQKTMKPIMICCNSGKDMSVAVVLCILCMNYNFNWRVISDEEELQPISKNLIRKHLNKLIDHLEGRNINPPRTTLTSVTDYLFHTMQSDPI